MNWLDPSWGWTNFSEWWLPWLNVHQPGKRFERSPGDIGAFSKAAGFIEPFQRQQNRKRRAPRLTFRRTAPVNTSPMLIHDRLTNPQPQSVPSLGFITLESLK